VGVLRRTTEFFFREQTKNGITLGIAHDAIFLLLGEILSQFFNYGGLVLQVLLRRSKRFSFVEAQRLFTTSTYVMVVTDRST